MRRVLVRYKLKPGRSAENEELVRGVFAALAHAEPPTFSYTTFRSDDGLTYYHLAMMEGENPLLELPAFRAFLSDLGDRCAEPPQAVELTTVVGSYRSG